MTKKFTEEEYQKIADCFDKLKKEYNMGILNPNVTLHFQEELFNDFDFINDWPEIVAIMNPITRDWAHAQFVEKEKNYIWKYKKTDEDGDTWYLEKDSGLIVPGFHSKTFDSFTEKEVIEAGYNPDMYDRKEVE
ncbi:MAG: hypothetical protein [Caudoviricetes sp.]|nr:MAG: hypothetical protein [Caudoviricetes sp.]